MRRAKDALRCRNCGERVGAKMNYCGKCGAAIANPPSAATPPDYGCPQRAEAVAAPVDWPLQVVDEANAPLNFDRGVDLEPTIPSLVGPGPLIMPAPPSRAAPQPPSALPGAPQVTPQAGAQIGPEIMPEFAAQIAEQVAAHIASTPAAHIPSMPQVTPVAAAAPLAVSPPLAASPTLEPAEPLVAPAPSVRVRTRFLAAALEVVTPGLGMMYTCNFWLGALVLVSTLFTTFLLIGVAIANAGVVRLADAINFLSWLLLAHVLWLIARMFWVWNMFAPRPALPTV